MLPLLLLLPPPLVLTTSMCSFCARYRFEIDSEQQDGLEFSVPAPACREPDSPKTLTRTLRGTGYEVNDDGQVLKELVKIEIMCNAAEVEKAKRDNRSVRKWIFRLAPEKIEGSAVMLDGWLILDGSTNPENDLPQGQLLYIEGAMFEVGTNNCPCGSSFSGCCAMFEVGCPAHCCAMYEVGCPTHLHAPTRVPHVPAPPTNRLAQRRA